MTIQLIMIRSFKHKGIERFFQTGSKAGIQPQHANKCAFNWAGWMPRRVLPTWICPDGVCTVLQAILEDIGQYGLTGTGG